MDSRPVGFLDSGLGGVSVLGEALRVLPNENYVYFGDTLHAPYGDRQPQEVLAFTRAAVDRLVDMGCKAVVIACNTATAVAAGVLREQLRMPVIGMEPALKPASLLPGEGKVLVMATTVTLSQPKFHHLMELYGRDAIPLPCPGLMECAERGEVDSPHTHEVVSSLLAPYRHVPIKAVVLGCTHYPFLKKTIAAHLPPNTPLVDGNLGTVRQLGRRLKQEDLLSDGPGGKVRFVSSLEEEGAVTRMQQMLAMWRAQAE